MLLCALILTLLGGCRLLLQFQGEGMLLAENTGNIYRSGDVLDVQQPGEYRFRPVPMPGHRFTGWTRICGRQASVCPLNITAEGAAVDFDAELLPGFAPYEGPLRLTGGALYEGDLPEGDFLRVPDGSLDIEGLRAGGADLRLFLATRDLSFVLAGERNGGGVDFTLPAGAPGFDSLFLIVSALDSDNVLASTALEFPSVPEADAANLAAYRPDSPYAGTIARCVSADNAFELCDFETLPLLGMETDSPTLEQVLERTVVSHSWMGDRFAQLMARMPDDMYRMLRGVTAVVISANVRPAYYLNSTGAIHIDPAFLWLTNAEKSTVSRQEDFRADFGSELRLDYFEDYMVGNSLAFQFYPLDGFQERSLADAEFLFAWVMFHELAHANDFAPPSQMTQLGPQDSMMEAFYLNEPHFATTQLESTDPLLSELLMELAAVYFLGETASDAQRGLFPSEAGTAMQGESASSFYGYSTAFEDTATLVERAMMRYHFGADAVTTFVSKPSLPEFAACDDYIIGWGQRSRISDARVRARTRLVLATVLGTQNTAPYVDGAPPVTNLATGIGYCSSLFQSAVTAAGASEAWKKSSPHPPRVIHRPLVLTPRL